jgi:hypothetical protein
MKPLNIEMKETKESILDEILEAIDTKRRFFAIITDDGYCHISRRYFTGIMSPKLIIADPSVQLSKSDITMDWLEERITDELYEIKEYGYRIALDWPMLCPEEIYGGNND